MANGIDRSVLPAEGSAAVRSQVALANAARAAGPPLLFGFRLWASVCLALFVAFRLELDNPYWAGASAAIVCQPYFGASLRKSRYRIIGTRMKMLQVALDHADFGTTANTYADVHTEEVAHAVEARGQALLKSRKFRNKNYRNDRRSKVTRIA